MPFKSEKQRRYLWANEPEIAREWEMRYGHKGRKNYRNIDDNTFMEMEEPSTMPWVSPNVAATDDRWTSNDNNDYEISSLHFGVRVYGRDDVRTRHKDNRTGDNLG